MPPSTSGLLSWSMALALLIVRMPVMKAILKFFTLSRLMTLRVENRVDDQSWCGCSQFSASGLARRSAVTSAASVGSARKQPTAHTAVPCSKADKRAFFQVLTIVFLQFWFL